MKAQYYTVLVEGGRSIHGDVLSGTIALNEVVRYVYKTSCEIF